MSLIVDDLAIAFTMRCDERGLSFEAGIAAAEELADEIMAAAEDRHYAEREERS